MNILYGIKNCDSVKKARKWLDEQHIAYQFHDFRTDGLTQQQLSRFISQGSWEKLLNKRSTSWKQLEAEQKRDLTADKAAALMLDNPTLIKRPVLEADKHFLIGFSVETYQILL